MDRKAKIWKTIGIIAIVAVILLLLEYCSGRKEKHRQEAESKVYTLIEELNYIADIQPIIDDMDYYEMQDRLYEITEKCSELKQLAEELKKEFAETEYDDESYRRNWWLN